jgi:FkbM family methyltransferase
MKLARKFGRFVFGKILPDLAYPVIKGPLKGFRFILGTHGGGGGGATVYFNMVEPKQTDAFVAYLKKGDVLFDVGANVGYYTVLGSTLVGKTGKVFSFEPFVRNISFLYRHIEINHLKNVVIVPSAVSNELGMAAFYTNVNSAMGHVEGASSIQTNREQSDVLLVSTFCLDEVSEKLNQIPDVLKIDVEGAELNVLKGASKKILPAHPVIFLSVHSSVLREHCLQLLKPFGYHFQPLDNLDENIAMEFLCIYK